MLNVQQSIESLRTCGDSFLAQRIAEALDLGEGYVLITVDPDGIKVLPVRGRTVNETVHFRKAARSLSNQIRSSGGVEGAIVAAPEGDVDGTPSDRR